MSTTPQEICKLCSKVAKNKSGLSAHMRLAHKETKAETKLETKPELKPPAKLEAPAEAKEPEKEVKPVNDLIWKLWAKITDGDERAVMLSYLDDTRSELEVLTDILGGIKSGDSRAVINQHIQQYEVQPKE